MESRELFLSLHLFPFHWVEWGGSEKKASLSLSYSLARPFIQQTDTMFQKLCPRCSHAFLLGCKRRVFSQTLSPPFLNPGEEGRSGSEVVGGTDPPTSFTEELGTLPSLCGLLLRMRQRGNQNGASDVGWSERCMKWQLWHRQQGRRARNETDQVLDCISRARGVTFPSPILCHLNEILFSVKPPEVASNYIPILQKL